MKTFILNPISPFRLDYTAWALRRRSKNIVDNWDGKFYARLFVIENEPILVILEQKKIDDNPQLKVTVDHEITKDLKKQITILLEKIFKLNLNLQDFYKIATKDSVIKDIVNEFKGVKPPRFPSLFETLCNAIACQLLSLEASIHLLNNLAENYGKKLHYKDKIFHSFPEPNDIAKCKPNDLRELGFSMRKGETLIQIAKICMDPKSPINNLENMTDQEVISYLCSLKGIGRWSAEYTLLRGLGRIHWLPGDDIGVQRNLQNFFHLKGNVNYERVMKLMTRWDPYAGMIYFHLLLRKLKDKDTVFWQVK